MEQTLSKPNNTEVNMMNPTILTACKELINDAKLGCADLVFKEICLEILTRAKHILTKDQFVELSTYAAEKMKEKNVRVKAELRFR